MQQRHRFTLSITPLLPPLPPLSWWRCVWWGVGSVTLWRWRSPQRLTLHYWRPAVRSWRCRLQTWSRSVNYPTSGSARTGMFKEWRRDKSYRSSWRWREVGALIWPPCWLLTPFRLGLHYQFWTYKASEAIQTTVWWLRLQMKYLPTFTQTVFINNYSTEPHHFQKSISPYYYTSPTRVKRNICFIIIYNFTTRSWL